MKRFYSPYSDIVNLNGKYVSSLQYDLVCDNEGEVEKSTLFFYLGSLIGNVAFGYLADK